MASGEQEIFKSLHTLRESKFCTDELVPAAANLNMTVSTYRGDCRLYDPKQTTETKILMAEVPEDNPFLEELQSTSYFSHATQFVESLRGNEAFPDVQEKLTTGWKVAEVKDYPVEVSEDQL